VTERDLARPHERVQVADLHIDRSAPPETLAAMVAAADAVVVARITRQDFRIEPCGGIAVTLATAAVRTVIKSHPRLTVSAGRIVIHRLGGAWREPMSGGTANVVREQDVEYPSLVTGSEYLLFLTTAEWGYRWPADVWRPLFDEYGTVGVAADGTTLHPLAADGAVRRAATAASLVDLTAQLQSLASRLPGAPAAAEPASR
jgi:hypothetical protein